MSTASTQLASVQAAIAALESANAQEISGPDGRHRVYLKLDTLYKRERDLLWQVARENNGDVFVNQQREPE